MELTMADNKRTCLYCQIRFSLRLVARKCQTAKERLPRVVLRN